MSSLDRGKRSIRGLETWLGRYRCLLGKSEHLSVDSHHLDKCQHGGPDMRATPALEER